LRQLPPEVLDILIFIHTAALPLEPNAKLPHLPTLVFELVELVVIIGCQRLSAPEIDQHLAARLERLLDFLLGARLVENLFRVTWIAPRRAHPRPKDRNDDLAIRWLPATVDRRLRRAIGEKWRVGKGVVIAEYVEF